MVISGERIRSLIQEKKIVVVPDPEIKSASFKLHVADTLTLKPKSFNLAKTLESITLCEGVIGLYDGYAKLSQRGVMTHLGSMLCDSDTNGVVTLEIFNATDNEIVLEKGERCGQLILMEVK